MHIPDKARLFSRLYSLMAPGGRLVITDYARGKTPGSPEFERYIEKTGYSVIEPQQYGEVLKAAGFVNVVVDDATARFVEILRAEEGRLVSERGRLPGDVLGGRPGLPGRPLEHEDRLLPGRRHEVGHLRGRQAGLSAVSRDTTSAERETPPGGRPTSSVEFADPTCPRRPRHATRAIRGSLVPSAGDDLVPPTPDQADDNRDLAALGYRPVLNRTLGSFSAFAAGFSYISILTGVFQMFYVGYGAGGPAFFWTWPAVFLGQLTVALCFAELAARYPLSGGVYQWSRRTGGRAIGWLAGWIYLCGSVLSLAAVALALQGPLPQISTAFQFVGDPAIKADSARNAVAPRLHPDRGDDGDQRGRRAAAGPDQQRRGDRRAGRRGAADRAAVRARPPGAGASCSTRWGATTADPSGYLGPAMAAALMASYVLYGFDTAGTLAEETGHPRRRAPAGDPPGAGRRRDGRRAADRRGDPGRGRPGTSRAGADRRRPLDDRQGRAGVRPGEAVPHRRRLRGIRLRPGRPRGDRAPHLRHGAGQQPPDGACAGPRAAADAGPGAARAPGRGAGRGAPGPQHQPAARDRDPLRGGDRLGQPGVPAGDAADAGRATATAMESGAAGSGRRRTAVLDGPARPADQRDRVGVGPLRGAEHRLAAHRDLRAGSLGTVRGPAVDARPAGRGRPVLRDRPAPSGGRRPCPSTGRSRPIRGRRSPPTAPAIEGHWIGRLAADE